MSAVTLETLRAEVEAIDAIRRSKGYLKSGATLYVNDGPDRAQLAAASYEAHQLYAMARDHGLDRLMLFKLSDGNIDPRKEVRA